MQNTRQNQSGFSAVETLLILIVLGILGFTGWFVYHSKQVTDKTLSETGNTVVSNSQQKPKPLSLQQNSAATSQQQYLSIQEWGIKIPQPSGDVLSYKFTDNSDVSGSLISANLAKRYSGCETFGAGILARGMASDTYDQDGTTYKQAYAQNPTAFGKVGDYYYTVHHDQAACANDPSDASAQAENAANMESMQAIIKVQAE